MYAPPPLFIADSCVKYFYSGGGNKRGFNVGALYKASGEKLLTESETLGFRYEVNAPCAGR